LIGAEPGLHVESVGAAVKVLMIDGIKTFVSGLGTAQPVLSLEAVHEFTDRILHPRSAKKQPITVQAPRPGSGVEQGQPAEEPVSRARAIFDASETAKPFDPADFDFAMIDDASVEELSSNLPASGSTRAVQRPRSRPMFGMTPLQIAILAGLAAALVCILGVFAYLVVLNP
jgi:hypothetical protein